MGAVGICDTGLGRPVPLSVSRNLVAYREFPPSGRRHGILVAQTVLSIYPDAELYYAGGDVSSCDRLCEMLEWISQYPLDVLNLSLAFPRPHPGIFRILDEMKDRGVKIVCAWSATMKYPWSRYISAGGEGEIPAPEEFSTNRGIVFRGTSCACAIASAVLARDGEWTGVQTASLPNTSILHQINL